MKQQLVSVFLLLSSFCVQTSDSLLKPDVKRWIYDVLLPRKLEQSLTALRNTNRDRAQVLSQSYSKRSVETISFVKQADLGVNCYNNHNPDKNKDFIVQESEQGKMLYAKLALRHAWTGTEGKGLFYYLLDSSNFATCPYDQMYQKLVESFEQEKNLTYEQRLES